MASIDRVDNGWRVRWRTPEGDSRSKTLRKKSEAEKQVIAVEHSKLSGTYIDAAAGQIPFMAFSDKWFAAQASWRPSTRAHVERVLKHHLVPSLGKMPMASIKRGTIQALVKSASADLSPGTVSNIYRVMSAIFRFAVEDAVIARSPCQGINLPQVVQREVKPLSLEAVEALAGAIPARFRPLVILGAGAGLRMSECLGLRVDAIDFLRGQLKVTQQTVTVARVTTLERPKTPSSVRTVPLGQGGGGRSLPPT